MTSRKKVYGKRLRLSKAEVELIYQHRATHMENVNDNTALSLHLHERGIDKDDVVSVKHWQSASGEYRLSHHLDPKTGMYKGRQILDPEE